MIDLRDAKNMIESLEDVLTDLCNECEIVIDDIKGVTPKDEINTRRLVELTEKARRYL